MKKVLLQLDTDRHPSVFDRVVALDAGADEVMGYGGVQPADVAGLVHGLFFTRSPADLRHSAVWVGGSDATAAEALVEAARKACFGPFRVSVMMDANGCNTTAAAAVTRLGSAGPLEGRRAVVLAGTGPVGLRGALLLAREKAHVVLTSRSGQRAREAAGRLKAQHGVEVEPGDKGAQRDGKQAWGALAIGSLKMKIHRACIERLFSANDAMLDADAIYAVGRAL